MSEKTERNSKGDFMKNVVDFETVDALPEAAQREIRGQLYKLRRLPELRQADSLENRLVLAANSAMKRQNTYGECQECVVLSAIRNAATKWFERTMRPLQTYEELKQNQANTAPKEDRDVIDLMPDANGVWRMAED